MYVCHGQPWCPQRSEEALDYSCLWVAMWVLGTEPGSSSCAMLSMPGPSRQPVATSILTKVMLYPAAHEGRGLVLCLQTEFTIRNAKPTEESRGPINRFPLPHAVCWLAWRITPTSIKSTFAPGVCFDATVWLHHPSDILTFMTIFWSMFYLPSETWKQENAPDRN